MIGYLGTSTSYLGNIVLAFGATIPDSNTYSGVYKLLPGQKYDTFMTVNNDNTYEQTNVAIPNPFIETAPVNNE